MRGVVNKNTNLISTKNSTNTPLLAAGVFQGPIEDITKYNALSIIVTSDTAGTLNMQFSADGVNIDRVKSVKVNGNTTHTLAIISKFFSVQYVNGNVNQGYLRLQTIYHEKTIKMLTSTANQLIDDYNDVELMRIVNYPQLDFARGMIKDKQAISIDGRNGDVGTTTEDIWNNGGPYPWPTVAETIRIKAGGDVNDTAAGTGARSIKVMGLDANYEEIEETLTTAGASASAVTTQLFLRVLKAQVVDCGTRIGTNIGGVTLENTTSLNELAFIETGFGVTKLSMYTIPAGKNAFITRFTTNVDAGGNKLGTVSLNVCEENSAGAAPYRGLQKVIQFDNFVGIRSLDLDSYIKISEKSDIWCSGVSTGTGTKINTNVDLLIANQLL